MYYIIYILYIYYIILKGKKNTVCIKWLFLDFNPYIVFLPCKGFCSIHYLENLSLFAQFREKHNCS